ncbi:FG-GAP repeat domain-containing protein [Streptomyces sp. NPDC050842]|uniref:FG-GAP repeat domain-containing protein n=1 Tax=Streptomyces sp. NPDC050842 TaxID=3365636 RepID=UPI0037A29CA5
MSPASTRPRRRPAAAIAVALAATVGTLAASPAPAAAEAVTSAAAGTTAQEDAAALLPDSTVIGNGVSGFLTRHRDSDDIGDVYRWTRYEDGVTTILPKGRYVGSVRSDVVVKVEGTTYKLYDMATGADPVVIDAGYLGAGAAFVRLVGSNLVMEVPRAGGGSDVHLVGKPAGTLVDRKVTGVPATSVNRSYDLSSPDTLVVRYRAAGTWTRRVALVDVATATTVEDRPFSADTITSRVSTSATHLAWAESLGSSSPATLQVARRGQDGTTRVPIGSGAPLAVGLLGDDWVTYTVTEGTRAIRPNPLHALTARSLTDGRTTTLLDTVTDIRGDTDGGLLVQGATIEQGEGLYRIAVGPDGTPAATLVASTGRSLLLALADQSVPERIDFSMASSDPRLMWQFTGSNAIVSIELEHTASGKRKNLWATLDQAGRAVMRWTGVFDDHSAAYNGDYTWRMKAESGNGLSPSIEKTGTLKVVGKQAPHAFSDSSSPDLIFRQGGRLFLYDARQTFEVGNNGPLEKVNVGAGWDTYDRIVTPGDLGGAQHSDLIGRDRTGVLWFYAGTGKTTVPFATRTRIGGGWGGYDQLTAGSDLTGDSRSDLLATDKAGALWLYKGTGSATAPFAARTKVGGGWGVYNKIVATGNIGGGPAGDLVARDTAGVLWLYLGKGDGSFAARTRIGGGWGVYDDIVALGDTDRDGRPDLVAGGSRTGTDELVVHYGTGDWRKPFSGQSPNPIPAEVSRPYPTLF